MTPPPPLDVARLRSDTPACAALLHFDNAGASLSPAPVLEVVQDHLEREQRRGPYAAEEEAADELAGLYTNLARMLGCAPDEVAFVENATRAWDLAFHALPLAAGDRVLATRSAYVSNFMTMLQARRRLGVEVELVPDDEDGVVCVDALRARLDERVRLVALTHAPTNDGLLNPAAEVGACLRDHPAVYLLDACQSAGQVPLDVEELGCDMLAGTGRKYLRGPRGTGFLYVRRALADQLEPPFLDLRSADWVSADAYRLHPGARRFECWEGHVAGKLGLSRAVSYALELGLPAIRARVDHLATSLREQLAALPGVAVHDRGRQRSGIVTFTRAGEPAAALKQRLRRAGANVSTSTAAFARLDMPARGLDAVVRASVHAYNHEDEVEGFCRLVEARP